MRTRYLCKKHFQIMCQDLAKAEIFWHNTMALGLDACNSEDHEQAERCFGAAYETSNIILDRQVSHHCDIEIAANTLLSAQYLATSLVQLDQGCLAEKVLRQLHEKFIFLSRNSYAGLELRETLCNCLIPYIEKLYGHTLNQQTPEQSDTPSQDHSFANMKRPINSSKSTFWHRGSTLYH